MSIRTETIANIFADFLRRYSPPMAIKGQADLEKAERDGLLRVLLKFAPASDYDVWVNRALDKLEYQMKTRAWPTKGELGAVCSNLRKETGSALAEAPQPKDLIEVAADKMNRGEAVGDGFLYGRQAVEMLRRGLVPGDTMQSFRSALYFSMKRVWGEETARCMEANLIARHKAAESMAKAGEMPAGEPFKRMPKSEHDADAHWSAA